MEEEKQPIEEMPAQEAPKEEPAHETPKEVPAGGEAQEAPKEPAVTLMQEERTWAILAHASILLNLVTGFIGLIAAFVIWVLKRQESRYIAFQSLQAWVYQVAMLVFSVIMWVMVIILSAVSGGICSCLMVPAGIVVQIALIGYGAYAAYVCSEGRDFRYLLLGDWLEAYV